MKYEIRTATQKDADLLAEIIRCSFRDVADHFGLTHENCPKHPSNCKADWIQQHMQQGAIYYIFEQAGVPSGCVAMKPTGPKTCDLERLAVNPDHRQRGFGQTLVTHVFSEATHLGMQCVNISIIAEHSKLKLWYQKIGFTEGETKDFAHLPFRVMYMSYNLYETIKLREYQPGDHSGVAQIWHEEYARAYPGLKINHDSSHWTNGIDWLLKNCKIRVAVKDECVIGFMALKNDYIDQMYIKEKFWRQGIGSQFISLAKSKNPSYLHLHTLAQNERAIAFYEKHGFIITKRGMAPDEKVPDVYMEFLQEISNKTKDQNMITNPDLPVSGYQKTERLVYFARMCCKARLMQRGVLPKAYHEFIGMGFDGRCCRFLHVDYQNIRQLISEGKSDIEILEWCYAHGRRPNDEEVFIWNLFMEKRGWRDDDSELVKREKESIGLGNRDEIQTLFDFYDFDEGRKNKIVLRL